MRTLTTSHRRVKPARSIRLCVKPVSNCAGVVRITVGKEQADYFLTEIPTDFGRGFLVEKIAVSGEPVSYHVNIDGDKRTCECKGYLKWGRCKHGDGLAALIAAGRL
jgi:hypothetical protein